MFGDVLQCSRETGYRRSFEVLWVPFSCHIEVFGQVWEALEAVHFGAVFLGAFWGFPDKHESPLRPSELDPPDSLGGDTFKETPFLEASGRSQSGQGKPTWLELSAFTLEIRSKLIK